MLGFVTADGIRLAAIVLAGASFGVALVVIRHLMLRAPRTERFLFVLLGLIHLAVVGYVTATLVSYAGEQLTWRAPIALSIFTAKLIAMVLARELVITGKLKADPPQRRLQDPP